MRAKSIAYASAHGGGIAFERSPGTERYDRHAPRRANARDGGDVLGRTGEDHDIRCVRRVIGLAAAMRLAHGAGIGCAVAETVAQSRKQTLSSLAIHSDDVPRIPPYTGMPGVA